MAGKLTGLQKSNLERALKAGKTPRTELASKFGVTTALITYYARKFGCTVAPRTRKTTVVEPTTCAPAT